MAYTALSAMREINRKRFGFDVGPMPPYQYEDKDGILDLKTSALRFLHSRCEGMRFEIGNSELESADHDVRTYTGTGINPNQIPYNMQMDIDRLCLARELQSFIDSGVAEDAYTVYYSYLEMFLGDYGKAQKMVELLSEFESNASSLLMKHRDHYSHSVYVFALGLAIYESNSNFRREFKQAYGYDPDESNAEEDRRAAAFFLEFWGLTALFHDIGYPFEIPFEQVLAYFEVDNVERGKNSIFLSYNSLENLTGLKAEASMHFNNLYGVWFESTEELIAYNITERLGAVYGFTYEQLLQTLTDKPIHPDRFNYFMDHAYFSSARLYQELASVLGTSRLKKAHVDALSAIMLHNSLYKFAIAFYKDPPETRKPELKASLHPLAYLLMLCDELQCWDRTAYGRNSRKELHPMAADFDFRNNSIHATYYYDSAENEKITDFEEAHSAWEADVARLKMEAAEKGEDPENIELPKEPRLKAYSDMAGAKQRFRSEIESIVDTSIIPLTVTPDTHPADHKSKHTYLSTSNFLHLYDFAVALNGRYKYEDIENDVSTEQLEEEFNAMSLEYKLSNINQAKYFAKHLNAIDCFYTDKPVDFDMITEFSADQSAAFAPMEHERWIREHEELGWRYGEIYDVLTKEALIKACKLPADISDDELEALRKTLREQFRCHKLAMDGHPTIEEIKVHYDGLSEKDKGKDWKPFNCMLKLIKKYDGLRIYKLN